MLYISLFSHTKLRDKPFNYQLFKTGSPKLRQFYILFSVLLLVLHLCALYIIKSKLNRYQASLPTYWQSVQFYPQALAFHNTPFPYLPAGLFTIPFHSIPFLVP